MYTIITTINKKTESIERLEKSGHKLILIGDNKSEHIENTKNLRFFSIVQQKELDYQYLHYCPENHYTRKNIGYLIAANEGADSLYDTDDDNHPNENWTVPKFHSTKLIRGKSRFLNIYQYFSDEENLWPRGYPLDYLQQENNCVIENAEVEIGVWQGLADLDPDIDAIHRLIFNKEIRFEKKEPVALPKNTYCPFNSQNTFWTKKSYPALYLPSTVSFRMTDILRGFVAQKALWGAGLHLGFLNATVDQIRNEHNLLHDLESESFMYANMSGIVDVIDAVSTTSDIASNIHRIYASLVKNNFVQEAELNMLDAWLSDFKE
jgi:hypothetical protein